MGVRRDRAKAVATLLRGITAYPHIRYDTGTLLDAPPGYSLGVSNDKALYLAIKSFRELPKASKVTALVYMARTSSPDEAIVFIGLEDFARLLGADIETHVTTRERGAV